MYDALWVCALYNCRRRITRAVADMERRTQVMQAKLAEVEAELRTQLLFVPPLRARRPAVVRQRELIVVLRSADRPLTTREMAQWVTEKKKLPTDDPREVELLHKRVWATLTRRAKRGVVMAEAESRRLLGGVWRPEVRQGAG